MLLLQHCLDRIKQKRQKLLDKLRGTEEGQYAASADDFRIECERFAQVVIEIFLLNPKEYIDIFKGTCYAR